MATETEFVFVRVKSHRAADKLKLATGPLNWHWTTQDGGKFVKLKINQLATALAIKGISRTKSNDFAPCISWR